MRLTLAVLPMPPVAKLYARVRKIKEKEGCLARKHFRCLLRSQTDLEALHELPRAFFMDSAKNGPGRVAPEVSGTPTNGVVVVQLIEHPERLF